MTLEVEVPDLGPTGGDQATVVEWRAEEGDSVQEGEVILEIESESGVLDIRSPCAGVLVERVVDEDEVVRIGDVVAVIEPLGEGEVYDDEDDEDDEDADTEDDTE